MAEKRAHVIISGRVQGVFYRAFTEEVAASLSLKGWVRNMPDGRVEAVFEGGEAAIKNAISACREGPPAANVTDMDIDWDEPAGEQGLFMVRFF